jgi:hypothetical protein
MISVPNSLLERIDEAVDEFGTTRSAFLREAALEYIARRRQPPGHDPRVRAAHDAISALAERVNPASGDDSTTLIRSLRDSRAGRIAKSGG